MPGSDYYIQTSPPQYDKIPALETSRAHQKRPKPIPSDRLRIKERAENVGGNYPFDLRTAKKPLRPVSVPSNSAHLVRWWFKESNTTLWSFRSVRHLPRRLTGYSTVSIVVSLTVKFLVQKSGIRLPGSSSRAALPIDHFNYNCPPLLHTYLHKDILSKNWSKLNTKFGKTWTGIAKGISFRRASGIHRSLPLKKENKTLSILNDCRTASDWIAWFTYCFCIFLFNAFNSVDQCSVRMRKSFASFRLPNWILSDSDTTTDYSSTGKFFKSNETFFNKWNNRKYWNSNKSSFFFEAEKKKWLNFRVPRFPPHPPQCSSR